MEDRQQKKQPHDPEQEALIAEMLRDAEGQKVELPSELDKNPVIHRGDETLPAPMVKAKITSAGYVYVWDSRTYVKAPVLYYMLPQILRVRRLDGSYRWTTNDPGQLPKRGTHKCLLHKDDPNRAHYNELGFKVCPKDHIPNPYQVTQHMKSKHKAEWAAIGEERKERERQEDRKLQQLMVEAVAGKTVEQAEEPKPISIEPLLEEVERAKMASIKEREEAFKLYCPHCGADFTNNVVYEKHVKNCK